MNTELWMTNLPPSLRATPLIYLAIPGSHDSGTYEITRKSSLSPDAEPAIRRFRFLGPLLRLVMARWSKTQGSSVTGQLYFGVRYFDLRTALRKDGKFFLVHAQYSVEIEKFLGEVLDFLETHPGEAIILDFNHFYAFDKVGHYTLAKLLHETFNDKILPCDVPIDIVSLDYLARRERQLIVVYRENRPPDADHLWPSECFPTPWADTTSVKKLIPFLQQGVENRNNKVGFISQCVLTPSSGFICKNLFSSLKKRCVLPLEHAKYDWFSKQKAGHGGVNIIITDFVDYNGAAFAETVVALNYKSGF